jgi:hypothetical protein
MQLLGYYEFVQGPGIIMTGHTFPTLVHNIWGWGDILVNLQGVLCVKNSSFFDVILNSGLCQSKLRELFQGPAFYVIMWSFLIEIQQEVWCNYQN